MFYGAPGAEAPAMAAEHVCVVGGANSAGQAALHLARFASRVTMLVRGESLASGMSDYLVTQMEATRNIDVRLGTRVADGHGQTRLESLTLEDVRTGRREEVAAAAVFVMIGAEPHTHWLSGQVTVNDRGFILTGRDLPHDAWPVHRPPLPFETSVPGVFAAGDVRFGSNKRVTGAAGEGSVAVGSVHRYLAGLDSRGGRPPVRTDRTPPDAPGGRFPQSAGRPHASSRARERRTGCRGGHLGSGWLVRTEDTTSRMAWVVALAYRSSVMSAICLAPVTTRCELSVDKVASLF